MGCHCSQYESKEEKGDKEPFMELLKKQIEEYPILLYLRSECENSIKAKSILEENSVFFEYFELNHIEEDEEITKALKSLTGHTKTPYIFMNGRYINGVKALQEKVVISPISRVDSMQTEV